jgi:hypothetical protein
MKTISLAKLELVDRGGLMVRPAESDIDPLFVTRTDQI